MTLSFSFFRALFVGVVFALSTVLAGCAGAQPRAEVRAPTPPKSSGLLLGIDVLEQQDFQILRGKRIGLLTHPAGVNRFGLSTIEVIRRDRRLNLVALFGVEHGVHGALPANEKYDDHIDPKTGLKVYSLYSGRTRKATPEQLAAIDVLVIDLQDIGTRSYTFVSAMRYQLEACFENNKEVVVLDRPNPLGGFKVSGPILDREWLSYVGAFEVPYVHGMTIGELARMAAIKPGVLQVSDEVRRRGRLTVVPMRGWQRSMIWPQTGLRWVPTSRYIPSFEAVVGYPMTGLGAQLGGFRHGIGTPHPFRFLSHESIPRSKLVAELNRRNIPGLRFVSQTTTGTNGQAVEGVFIEVSDWNAWRPTDLDFHMMQIAAAVAAPRNPFAAATEDQASLFNKHVGSTEWWNAIKRSGSKVDVNAFIAKWDREARAFQAESRRYWMYQ